MKSFERSRRQKSNLPRSGEAKPKPAVGRASQTSGKAGRGKEPPRGDAHRGAKEGGGRARAARGHTAPAAPGAPQRLAPESFIMGRHAVKAILEHNPARAKRLHLQAGVDVAEIQDIAQDAGLEIVQTSKATLDALSGQEAAHQGVLLEVSKQTYVSLEDALDRGVERVLILDGVEDPRNLGAAARAAFTLGVDLLVIPTRRAAPVTAAAHKAAAGALAQLDVAQVENLSRALDQLKAAGFWLVGAEADGAQAPWEVEMSGNTAFIIGGEDRGLRRLTREHCDFVVSIPMAAAGYSLNAADAATVLLYEAMRQRRGAGVAR